MFALLRRERERAAAASPLVRARIHESLPKLFPDVSDQWPDPACHDELEREGLAEIDSSHNPLVFSRELVAHIRTIHDAPPLVRLFTLPDSAITDYQPGPDEPGPIPTKSFLRYRALANIPAGWIAMNRVDGRKLLVERLTHSTDPIELLLIHDVAIAVFDQSLFGHTDHAVGREGPDLLRAWITDLPGRFDHAPTGSYEQRATIELVLYRLLSIGTLAVRYQLESPTRALIARVLEAKGTFPLTQNIPGAPRDVAEVARLALVALESKENNVSPRELPPPRRARFDPRTDWLDQEPANGQPAEAERRARVEQLESDLSALHYNATKCYVLSQLGRWLSPTEMTLRFDAIVTPAMDLDRGRNDTTSLCRLRTALAFEGTPEGRRATLLEKLLETPKQEHRDYSGDEVGPAIAYPTDDWAVRKVGAHALSAHLDWIATHSELRNWLEREALLPIPTDADLGNISVILSPAFERLLEFHLASKDPHANPAVATAILRSWVGAVRTARALPPASHIYRYRVTEERTRALGEYGARAGLKKEVGALFDELHPARDVAVARYLLETDP
jgi:hypothetical protein